MTLKEFFKLILPIIKKYKLSLFFLLTLPIIESYFNLVLNKELFGLIIDKLTSNNFTFYNNWSLLLCFVLTNYSSTVKNIISSLFTNYNIYGKFVGDIKLILFRKTIDNSISYFNDSMAGKLAQKINIIALRFEGLDWSITSILSTIIIAIIILFKIYFLVSFKLMLFLLLWIITYLFINYKTSKVLKNDMSELSGEESTLVGNMNDIFTNIQNVKIFSQEKKEKSNFKKLNINVFRKSKIYFKDQTITHIINIILLSIITTISFFELINIYLLNKITIGELTSTIMIIMSFIFSLSTIGNNLQYFFRSLGIIEDGLKDLKIDIDIKNSTTAKNIKIDKPFLELKNISFRYNNNLPYTFNNFSLSIPPYQKVGIVGYSGAGKSIVNLLLRFYDVDDGEIIIDKYNIKKDITQESLRDNISYIPQDPILFHRTIRENILYGKLDATEEELIEATKKAYCYDFINTLENKFDTLVGERGVKLSGGQRQRIAIARAILKNSPILILDEATSSLDTITEKEIQKALNNLMLNKTVIVIAHRLSTLNNMDRIITIDKGQIVEDGTMKDLLNNPIDKGQIVEDGTMKDLLNNPNGLFKRMYDMQKDGVLGELN